MDYKDSNEITLKIKGTLEDFKKSLEEKGYSVTEKFILDDIYMIRDDLDLNKFSPREILSKALLIREVRTEEAVRDKCITYKKKEFDEKGNIISQSSINLKVENLETAENLLSAIGYKRLMHPVEEDVVYRKEGALRNSSQRCKR